MRMANQASAAIDLTKARRRILAAASHAGASRLVKTQCAYRLSANAILFQAGSIVHAQFFSPFENGASSRVLLAIGAPELCRNLPARAVGTPPSGASGSLNGPTIRPAAPRRWIAVST